MWSPEAGPAPAATYTPEPPAAQPAAAPPQLPFGVTGDDLNDALRVVSRSLLPALAGLTVLVAVVALFAAPEGHGGSLADWLRTAVLLLALAVGGRAVVDGSVGNEMLSAEMSVGARVLPLVLTVLVLALVARGSTAAERTSPSTDRQQLLVRSAVTGLVAGAGTAIVVALSRTGSVYAANLADEFDGVGVEIGAGVLGALVGATALVSLTAAAARARVSPAATPLPGSMAAQVTPERAAALRPVLATLRTFLLGLLGAAAIGIVLAFLHRAYLTDDLDGDRWQALAALLVLSANAVLVAALGALGVPMTFSGESRGNADLLDFVDDTVGASGSGQWTLFDDKVWLLALLVPLAVALGTAVRRTLRQPGVVIDTSGVKTAAVCGAAAGLVAALLVRVSVSGSVDGAAAIVGEASASGSLSAGPSLLWAPLLGAAWAAFAVWALRWGPTLALSIPAGVTRAVAGRQMAPEWAAALTGAAPAPAGARSAGIRMGAVLAGAALVLGAVGAAVVASVNAFVFTPQAAAEDYLDAIADRDVPTVLAALADAPEPGGKLFLTEEALDSDDFTPISDVSVGDVEEYGDSAQVSVTYSVDGGPYEGSLNLVLGEERFGLFRTWEVSSSLPTVEVYSDSDLGARFAGTELADGSYLALPGSYVVRAAEHGMLTADPSRFVVPLNSSNGPTLAPVVKPEALENARTAVEDRIAECASSTTLPLDNCPFLTWWSEYSGDIADVAIDITTAPEFSFEYDPYNGVLNILTEEYGELTVIGTVTDTDWFGEPTVEAYEDEVSFTVAGQLTGSADDLEVQFDD